MFGYQTEKFHARKWSVFFPFVSCHSGFTSAVSPSIASINSAPWSSRPYNHIREARLCDQPVLVAAPAVDHGSLWMWPRDKPLLVAAPTVHHSSRGMRPRDNLLLVAAPAVDHGSRWMWPRDKTVLVATPAVDHGSCWMWPRDKPPVVAAPAVDHWSYGMWVGSIMIEVQSLSWDGTEGRKTVVPGCEENNKIKNWNLELPAHVGGTVTVSIQISTDFWEMKLIIWHLLYCYNSLHS